MKTTTKKVAAKKVAKATPKKAVAKKVITKPVKPAVKKLAAPKTVAKKTSTAPALKTLVVASSHNSFWMNDGQILNTLVALAGALRGMDAAVYKYHTNNGRHDFANWVDDVLGDIDCAVDLRTCKTAKTAQAVVVKHLKKYSY
ncbi:MAG: hypothetical protein V4606_04820 [Patescibacteria group bacterium]